MSDKSEPEESETEDSFVDPTVRQSVTRLDPSIRDLSVREASQASNDSSIDGARFVAGTFLAGRFRLGGLLGRGGMGEVYRAEDLKLGETVALKFLPDRLVTDGAALARFHREVRIARQVSHPNVCRVFDIGESDGLHFLAMEYIDGENLSSLLRRIGRLPVDKALELARQVCAGLAAVHARGILHRDLKPANVMIDGEGTARLTDFGLAHLAEEASADMIAGTAAYMAPEQFLEGRASVQSDLYALGLLIYEMLTGRKFHHQAGIKERLRTLGGNPAKVIFDVEGIPPAVVEIVEQCLAFEPERRPSAALEVAMVLAGGDPLAAALAAGETPSPEMVAGAHRQGILVPRAALFWSAVFLLALAGVAWLGERTTVVGRAALDKPPVVLADRAETLLEELGYAPPPNADRAWGMTYDTAEAAAVPLRFWYRRGPGPLVPEKRWAYRPSLDDPPRESKGIVTVVLDAEGALLFLEAAPEVDFPVGEPDWAALLSRAGLATAALEEVPSATPPPVYADHRRAWRGSWPGSRLPIRVEAAALGARPVYFDVRPRDTATVQLHSPLWWGAMNSLFLLLLIAGLLLARRNLRLGRGDRDGAWRIFAVAVAGSLGAWLLGAHHVGGVEELQLFFARLASALLVGGVLGLLYLALEPTVRRRWPTRIVAWNRLLGGRWRDPLVGRELGAGMTLYLVLHFLSQLERYAGLRLGWGDGPTRIQGLEAKLGSVREAAGYFLGAASWLPVLTGLGVLFLLVTLRKALKSDLAAALALGLILFALAAADAAVSTAGAVAYAVAMTWAATRWGLLAVCGVGLVVEWVVFCPLTADPAAWYAPITLIGVGATAVLGLGCFWIASAPRAPVTDRGRAA